MYNNTRQKYLGKNTKSDNSDLVQLCNDLDLNLTETDLVDLINQGLLSQSSYNYNYSNYYSSNKNSNDSEHRKLYYYLGTRSLLYTMPSSINSNLQDPELDVGYYGKQKQLDYLNEYNNLNKYQSLFNINKENPETEDYNNNKLLQAHIYQLTSNVYFHLVKTGLDQSLVLIGDNYSGKSYNKKQFIKQLKFLRQNITANPSKREKKLYETIEAVDLIYSNLTFVPTFPNLNQNNANENKSRNINYMEIQFDHKGRTVGLKLIDYLTDKNKLKTNTNYTIFYEFIKGLNSDEKLHFKLDNNTSYNYLRNIAHYSNITTNNNSNGFEDLKNAFKKVGFNMKYQTQIYKLLACIIHIGNIQFISTNNENENNSSTASVKNIEILSIISDFLGITVETIENLLLYKTKTIKKQLCTVILDVSNAYKQRDELACLIYKNLFLFIVEFINTRLCVDNNLFSNFIGLLDMPGVVSNSNNSAENNSFEQFMYNYANEKIYDYMMYQLFEANQESLKNDNIYLDYIDHQNVINLNTKVMDLIEKKNSGLINIMDKQANRLRGPIDDIGLLAQFNKVHYENEFYESNVNNMQFTISHFNSLKVGYSIINFMDSNLDLNVINSDFVYILSGKSDIPVYNSFVCGLFSNSYNSTNQNNLPKRSPSNGNKSKSLKSKSNIVAQKESNNNKMKCVATQFKHSFDELINKTLDMSEAWFLICLKTFTNNSDLKFLIDNNNPSNNKTTTEFDTVYVTQQLKRYNITQIIKKNALYEYSICYAHDEFCARYNALFALNNINFNSQTDPNLLHNNYNDNQTVIRSNNSSNNEHLKTCTNSLLVNYNIPSNKYALGVNHIYLNDLVWRLLEDELRLLESSNPNKNITSNINDNNSIFTTNDNINNLDSSQSNINYNNNNSEIRSNYSIFTDNNNTNKLILEDNNNVNDEEIVETIQTTKIRKIWVAFVYLCTFLIPSSFLSGLGKMKLRETRLAWREKLTLCMLIFLLSIIFLLFIIFMTRVVCPLRNIVSLFELQDPQFLSKKPVVLVHGKVYDLTKLGNHYGQINENIIKKYKGKDLSDMFPMQVNALCKMYDGSDIDDSVALQPSTLNNNTGNSAINLIDPNYQFHDHRYYRSSDNEYNPGFYKNAMLRLKYSLTTYDFATDPQSIMKKGKQDNHKWVILNNNVYDLNKYLNGEVYNLYPSDTNDQQNNQNTNDFLDPTFRTIVRDGAGTDITNIFNRVYAKDKQRRDILLSCLNNLFYAGKVDDRNSVRCQFASYFPLALTIFLFLVIFVKFLASLHFGSVPDPEHHDQYVILTVPCYTEGLESLKKTLDSLAKLEYDDKRKLLFVVCDGMVVGSGNDDPTPRIVLDVLNYYDNTNNNINEPESLSFLSLGEGIKQHNMGKVYTGLYECGAHVVPYLVVVKTGRPTERNKPGNRGKRDSQLILMRFFNKVHYDLPMSPLELEIYHQIKNVVGVDPILYEYVLMVDADTYVLRDSLNRMISSMMHDTKVMGLCGETSLANENDTWATMIQVYEYFISHYLAKSFESLFGSVTCLPGCFSMYRLKTPVSSEKETKMGQSLATPLLINNSVINEYSENRVDTLHKKNLLHLGEDRYLTTLLLKNFPLYKMTFVPDAKCLTNAPDTWKVLLSQRRRWINSTVHNLFELVFLPRLCGFCCFSMRFVVFIDLFSTLVMPAGLLYLAYFIYLVIATPNLITGISIAFIVAPYVLQVLVFIFRRQWQHVGWLIIYILSLPIFSFFIPIYSFWHFDDFSWGKTHIVIDNSGKKKLLKANEEIKFDPRSIPMKKWSDYEDEINPNNNNNTIAYSESNFNQSMVYQQSEIMSPPLLNNNMNNSYTPSLTNINNINRDSYMSNSNNNVYTQQSFVQNNDLNTPYNNKTKSTNSGNSTLSNKTTDTEQRIVEEVHNIIQNSDLMHITKKQVRLQVAQNLNISNIDKYRELINSVIEQILMQHQQ